MNINKLLEIFGPLKKEQKVELYEFLIRTLQEENEQEKQKLLTLLRDFKEDLLYYDEELEDVSDKVYVTQNDLADMFDVSVKTIQRIIKSQGIEPVNRGSKPYYYDFDEFKKYFFIYKKLFNINNVLETKNHLNNEFLKYWKYIHNNEDCEVYPEIFENNEERGENNGEKYPPLKLAVSVG